MNGFNKKIKSSFHEVSFLVKEIETHFENWGLDQSWSAPVVLSLSEALNNVVEHSYEEQDGNDIHVLIDETDTFYEIQIHDSGKFNPSMDYDNVSMPDPEDLPDSGWGISIIKNCVDAIAYENFGEINILKMRKNK